MHYQGFVGVPRRYYEIYDSPYIDVSTLLLNKFITIAVLIVGAAQLLFLYNLFASARLGKRRKKSVESQFSRVANSANASRTW